MLERGAVDYFQPDVNRVGGVTEARKIWAVASAYNVPIVPHAQNYHNQHLILASMNSPMSEFFPSDMRDADTFFFEFFIGEPVAVDGHIEVGDAPGFGVELNEPLVEQF